MVQTRLQKQRSMSRRRSMRRRVKASRCRAVGQASKNKRTVVRRRRCNKTKGCKFVSGPRRKFCRKSRNIRRRR